MFFRKLDSDMEDASSRRAASVFSTGLRRGALAAAAMLVVLLALSILHPLFAPGRERLSDYFLYQQDFEVAVLYALVLAALSLSRPWLLRFPLKPPPASWRTVSLIALAVTAAGWAGSYLVYDDFALSMDEFMARFDAQILATGQLAAPVPPEWRAYVEALQPIFMLDIPGHAYWVSNYLPVNAAFLALGLKLGVQNLAPALWAGISVLATFGVARRLWPDKPGAGLVAAALLASSPQLIITAMTPYAMSAHLALNMVWLWLYLRGGRLGHGLAAVVAFLATGLHQLVFHPLFAAPFVLELWLAKRWKPALWHTAAFAVIGVFWALYQPMLVHLYGAGTVVEAAERHGAASTLVSLLASFDVTGLGYIAKNLVRLVTWQNLLLAPLALVAFVPAIRARGALRALSLGMALTLVMLFFVMPYQGHGWGYRYLHGFLGSLSLLAAWIWTRLSEAPRAEPQAGRAVFALGLAASVACVLPLRAAQAHAFEHPYAVAVRQIQATDADVVILDERGLWYGIDLVRNQAGLDNRPVVVAARTLTDEQKRALCSLPTVAWFGREDGARAGLMHAASLPSHAASTVCSPAPVIEGPRNSR